MLRKLTLCLTFLVTLLLADTSAAIDAVACCLPTTSRLDALMNPVRGGDEKFFSKPGVPPNVLFIVDTTLSMHAWPRNWPSSMGCAHNVINGLGYDPSVQYPSLWTSMTTSSDKWFNARSYYPIYDKGYGYAFERAPIDTTSTSSSPPAADTWTSAAQACGGVSTNSSERARCEECLTKRGYYIGADDDRRRIAGNFLNFYAPRDSGAVKVLADVVHSIDNMRFGVMSFHHPLGQPGSSQRCFGPKTGSNSPGMCMIQDMGPTCAESYPLNESASFTNRDTFLKNLANQNGAVNGMGWEEVGRTPLADSLYAAGYYFQNKQGSRPTSLFFGANEATPRSPDKFSSTRSPRDEEVCFECGVNAVIVLTDGEPVNEGQILPLPDAIQSLDVPCPGCKGNLHKVAKYWHEHDLRSDKGGAGPQNLITYTIGFGTEAAASTLLQVTAAQGGGTFQSAGDTVELKRALQAILDDINHRATAFSATAVNTTQTQTSSTQAIVPRMQPSLYSNNWVGKLFRFSQFNEFVEGVDKNGDTKLEDVFLVDKSGAPVAENADGEFRKINVFSGNSSSHTTEFGDKAEPFWEAGAKLLAQTPKWRKIYTVIDSGSKDGVLNQNDGLVEFNLQNLALLQPYLAISPGANLCPTPTSLGDFLSKMGMSAKQAAALINAEQAGTVPENPLLPADLTRLCNALLIQYVRGQDLFDEDDDKSSADMRPSVLGDIFHSTPLLVNPPADKFLCDLAVSNQCVRTLYAKDLNGTVPTRLGPGSIQRGTCSPKATEPDAYDAYQYNRRMRQRLILVGANDGMLHAFRDATGSEDADCNINYVVDGQGSAGDEAWAFIPPDLLPQLQEMLAGHTYYVDGDIMVRDIWADDNEDGEKTEDEFHTMAVVAEGRGGTHYFALELKWEGGAMGVATKPNFRWMFPQPCTDEALSFGKTLFSLNGKAPPIAPVLLKVDADSRRGTARDPALPNIKSEERWVAMLSGGWSPGGEKGRGLYMVDVWNGRPNGARKDNLLWKWDYAPDASGDGQSPRKFMRYGFASPVAMADYGTNQRPSFNGFADTAVVGDLGGQLWTLRFSTPGDIRSSGLVENWSGGRSFSMDRQETAAGQSEDISKRSPFFFMTELALQLDNKALRAFVGTGNRYSIVDESVGTCRFDNPEACAKLGCSSAAVDYQVTRGTGLPQTYQTGGAWTNRTFKEGSNRALNTPASYTDYCGLPLATSFIDARFNKRETTCTKPAGGTETYNFNPTLVQCGQTSTDVFDCRAKPQSGPTSSMGDVAVKPPNNPDELGKNRFFGLWAYGGTSADRLFDEDPRLTSSTNLAGNFDYRRLTDTNNGTFKLLNVTNVRCELTGACTCPQNATNCDSSKPLPGPDDVGWFVEYSGPAYKTASGASVMSSCALWNSMSSVPSTSVCASPYLSKAQLFQGDYITGAPNCAAGFLNATTRVFARSIEREVSSPPLDPSISIQVSKKGEVRYSALNFEPGPNREQATQLVIGSNQDPLQLIYELPVSQGLHNCRHEASASDHLACVPSDL